LIELASSFPKINALSIEEIKLILDWLQARIGLSNEKLVQCQPTILNLSVKDNLQPNISWLQGQLKLDQESLQRGVLSLIPVFGLAQLLGSNMETNPELDLLWLQEKLKLDDDSLWKLVKKESSSLGLSLESHKARVSWLQKRLALNDASLRKLVQRLPRVLRYSVE
jgi:hypothetical protein